MRLKLIRLVAISFTICAAGCGDYAQSPVPQPDLAQADLDPQEVPQPGTGSGGGWQGGPLPDPKCKYDGCGGPLPDYPTEKLVNPLR